MLTDAVCPALVGRREEIAALVARRAASARGHGSLVLIEGEAGIGKSRLVAAFSETLRNGRAGVGIGLCREFGNAPYAPIVEALADGGAKPVPPTGTTRSEALQELRSRTVAACERRNRVVILEDLQWADEGTLAFLHYMAPHIGSMRLLIVGTYRPDEMLANLAAPYLSRVARDRNAARMQLAPLSPMQVRNLIRLTLRERELGGAQIEQIVRRAEGNPFFAEELLRSAVESDDAPHGVTLPRTIRDAVMERMAKLEPAIARVAAQAAVLGPRFDADFLTETFGHLKLEVYAALRRLRDLGLIVELTPHSPAYAFRHALVRDAIYTSILAAEARPVHAEILRALEARPDARAQDLGYHAWAAGDAPKCRRYNEQAGDEAEGAHAHSDAVRAYELALAGATDMETRRRVLMKAALSAARDGLADRASLFYDAAAAAMKGCGTPQQIAEIYYAMGSQARITGDNQRAMAILERAVRDLPEQELGARAMLRITSALLHLDRGDAETARALIAEAQAAAEMPIYQNAVAYAALIAGDLSAFRTANAGYRRLCEPLGGDHVLRARFNLAFGLCVLGMDGEALAEFDSLLPGLHESRLTSLEILTYANAAIVHARAGRLRQARELVERGLAIPEPETTGPIALAAAGVSVGHALADPALVARCTTDGIVEAAFASRINTTLGRLAGPYARWLAVQGDAVAAQSILRRSLLAIHGPFGATETLLAAAELGDAVTRLAVFEFLPMLDELSHVQLYAATAQHLRALQARATGEASEARALAIEAARAYSAMGWRLFEARCLELSGERDDSAGRYTSMTAIDDLRRINPLSQREREIACLVAAGAANRRIAGDLAVSQRTVEKYLTSIYGKLGLRNRSELAAFVGRDATTPPRRSAPAE